MRLLLLGFLLSISWLYSQEIKHQQFSSKGIGVTKTKGISVTQPKALNVNNCCANLSNSFNNQSLINTFYPPQNNQIVLAGSSTIILDEVPPVDVFGNSYGDTPIQAGDLLLVIQMQGAEFNIMNSGLYGAGQTNSGPDFLGATGNTSLLNCGNYEYVIALNSVPLSGGILQIDNTCNGGLQYTYENISSTSNNVIKRFQVVRVPRFQNLILNNDILTTAWNGSVGGLIVLNVAETLNLNGFKIDASGKGFRGGFQNVRPSGNTNDIITTSDNNLSSGKGEGISGIPRFVWNGINAVDYGLAWVGYPGGDYGRGAPGNAGGGGNVHNAGGGGGGNGGSGGVGGNGWDGAGPIIFPNGGRPGTQVPNIPNKIFLGGGGGGGDANNATTGVKGGPGGGIIMINAREIIGNGQILSNGFNGEPGAFLGAPDGAGGGGSGGSILILTSQSSNSTSINIQTKGGKGGNTLNDLSMPHGPGGGGGGGIVMHNLQNSILNIDVSGGLSGLTGNGSGISHGSSAGQNGIVVDYTTSGVLPALLNSLYPNPKAQFDVNDICLGEIITPNNTSNVLNIYNSSIVSYNWNFGDGTTSILINPSHLYNQFGTFTITLTVLTNWGCSDTYTQIINVSNSTTPNFTQISPITCGNNFILPTISNNGITGTWTPVINNSLTTVYTFTPLTGQCANSTSMTIIVNSPSSPTGASTQTFCNSAIVANLSAIGTNIQWYSSPSGGTSLSNTTALVNGNTYYANQTVNGCVSPNRFPVFVNINVPSTPTGTSTQTFCNSGTISNLLVTGSNIRWYVTATGGTPLSNTTALVNGTTYYASQTISGCESLIRFPVNVIINTPASPTGNSNQLFCNSATVSNLTITGQNIQWYTTATGGTPLTNTTSLTNGSTYFASQTINGCESIVRAPVLVTVIVVPIPTGNSIQEFCKIDNPIVSNLTPNLPNIKWYTTLAGLNPLNPNTPLIDNASYFAEAIDLTTGCKSPNRLEVLVKINDSNPPTGDLEQIFCEEDNPTLSNLIMNTSNTLVWYDSAAGNNIVAVTTLLSNGDSFYASNFDSTTNCYSSERTKVDITLLPCELEINNLLTLNGNNLNDFIVIKNIETFPKNEFQIFNRYGKLVWRGYNYNNLQNTFIGKSNVQGVYNSNDYLPTGTYFYVLTYFDMYRNENKEVKGFLQINNNQ